MSSIRNPEMSSDAQQTVTKEHTNENNNLGGVVKKKRKTRKSINNAEASKKQKESEIQNISDTFKDKNVKTEEE